MFIGEREVSVRLREVFEDRQPLAGLGLNHRHQDPLAEALSLLERGLSSLPSGEHGLGPGKADYLGPASLCVRNCRVNKCRKARQEGQEVGSEAFPIHSVYDKGMCSLQCGSISALVVSVASKVVSEWGLRQAAFNSMHQHPGRFRRKRGGNADRP